MTLRDALRAAEQKLLGAGLSPAQVATDASILLAHALHDTLAHLPTRLREELADPDRIRFEALVARRAQREPLAYVVGETQFMGLPFRCDHRAFVPRPDTETLVQAALQVLGRQDMKPSCSAQPCPDAMPATASLGRALTDDTDRCPPDSVIYIADLGTGTGCIAISLAHYLPSAHIFASDISAEALALAQENARLNGVQERITFLHGADLQPLVAAGVADRIAAVVANPPYIPTSELSSLEPEVSQAEPREALDGGPDGLDWYRRVLPQLRHLPALRLLAVEFGVDQEEPLLELAGVYLPAWEASLRHDLSGLPRVLVATSAS